MDNLNNILWLPLDLPLLPKEITLDNINPLYTYKPRLSQEERQQLMDNREHHQYAWDCFHMRLPKTEVLKPYYNQVSDIDYEWTDVAKENCPELINYIETQLPFKNIKYVTAISSIGSVPLHLDLKENLPLEEKQVYTDNDPCFYRFVLDGTIHPNSFYVYTKKLGKVYCNFPDTSPGWVMGSYSCAHGNDEELPFQKILMYVMGDLDIDKHQELIQRSYSRYKDYAIVRNYET